MKILEVNRPHYKLTEEPDYAESGKLIDDLIRLHFIGQTIVVRGLNEANL